MKIKLPKILSASLIVSFFCFTLAFNAQAKDRRLLSGKYKTEDIKKILMPKDGYHPFPKAFERTKWESLPAKLKESYIKKGEQALGYKWNTLTVSDYLDYSRSGERERYSRPYNERRQKLQDLVLSECMDGQGRFLEQIANGIWLICEESSWTPPWHIVYQKKGIGLPDISDSFVDLSSSETGNLLAWTYYLLGDQLEKVSPLIKNRIASEIKNRILIPCLERDDFWWMWTPGKEDWSHVINNWVPWICSNWLASVLLVEEDNDLRVKSVYKIMQTEDRFINSYPDDGGCDEGPSYWDHAAGSMFESLELLCDASGGRIDLFQNPLVWEMGRYIYRAYIKDNYYVNFGDASARININGDMVLRYGVRIKDKNLAGLGALAASRQNIMNAGIGGSLTRQLYFLFNLDMIKGQVAEEPLVSSVWMPDTKFMAARQSVKSIDGLYIASIGSHNDKSHNHNDVGSFILYSEGEPCIIDAGVGTYTAKTFSPERYSIWTMQSAYHNLPTINGIMQKEGRQYAAKDNRFNSYPDSVVYSLDIEGAYPPEANIKSWLRTMKLDRTQGSVEIAEDYTASVSLSDLKLSLMTPCSVDSASGSSLILKFESKDKERKSSGVTLSYDPEKMKPEIQTIPLDDKRLRQVWGESLKRILFHVKTPGVSGKLKVIFKLTANCQETENRKQNE